MEGRKTFVGEKGNKILICNAKLFIKKLRFSPPSFFLNCVSSHLCIIFNYLKLNCEIISMFT